MNLRKSASLPCLFFLLLQLACRAETILAPYDCWGNLGFEDNPPVNISQWSANGTAITYLNDSAQAHGGHGAVRIDGSAPVSIWGGRIGGEHIPQTGDHVGGYFWLKLLSAPTANLIDVRMTGYLGGTETIYCNTASLDLTTIPLNTWTRISVVSAGNTFAAGSDVNFNIVSAGGVNCLIDDVTFGSLTVVPDGPDNSVVTTVLPPFQEYVGSTFNGDFEVGSAATGNQYWGQYIPQQSAVAGSPDMMKLITTPGGTAPGSIKSGKNMVSLSRGGVAWNIAALASSPADRLPRVGDLVGGSYWLYVPADADLSQGVPAVYFICQTPGGDVTIADTADFPVNSLVKGRWNRVPLYPKAGAAIAASATGAAIMITAPQLNSTVNPLYPATYYIDEIRVGKIPQGVFFSQNTILTDTAGVPISGISSSDTDIHVNAVVQNSADASARSGYLVLRLYEQDVLKSSTVKAVTIAGKGGAGISNTVASLSASLQGLDKDRLNARLYLYADTALQTVLAAPFSLIQKTRRISPTDPALHFIGRWSAEGAALRGNWIRPALKLTFSHSSSVKISLLQAASLSVVLDGVQTDYNSVNGLVTLGANLALDGIHTLRIAGLTWQDSLLFDALQLDDVGELRPTAVANDHIEFIGDSITAWNNGYSWLVPERLGVEGSRIAWPGDGYGYYTPPVGSPLSGMASAYFLNGMPGYGTAGAWNFATAPYSPNIVVINLGTNDAAAIAGNTGAVNAFQTGYRDFIQQVRARFPSAEIFVLRPFSITYADVQAAISNATQAAVTAGDTHLHYVNTSAWGVAIGTDGIHPTDAGHATAADRLQTLLSPYLNGGTKPYAPSFTSAARAGFIQGQPIAFAVSASGFPAPAFSAGGLPGWASLNPATGLLTGTPPQTGSFTFTLTATNGTGSAASQTFTATVSASFSQWAAARFSAGQLTDPNLSGATATPRKDGVPNLLKYAFDIDPTTDMTDADRGVLPQAGLRQVGGDRYLTLTYLQSAQATGITRLLQSSTDMQTWQNQVPDVIYHLIPEGAGGDSVVEMGVNLVDAPRKFLRLTVTIP